MARQRVPGAWPASEGVWEALPPQPCSCTVTVGPAGTTLGPHVSPVIRRAVGTAPPPRTRGRPPHGVHHRRSVQRVLPPPLPLSPFPLPLLRPFPSFLSVSFKRQPQPLGLIPTDQGIRLSALQQPDRVNQAKARGPGTQARQTHRVPWGSWDAEGWDPPHSLVGAPQLLLRRERGCPPVPWSGRHAWTSVGTAFPIPASFSVGSLPSCCQLVQAPCRLGHEGSRLQVPVTQTPHMPALPRGRPAWPWPVHTSRPLGETPRLLRPQHLL